MARSRHLAWRLAISDGTPRRSLAVARVIGTPRNLINQGDVILRDGPIERLKIALTCLVPYRVSACGTLADRLSAARDR
jgi:hypothetical protein